MPGYLKCYLLGLVVFIGFTYLFKHVYVPLHYDDNSIQFRRILALFGLVFLTMIVWTIVVAIMLILSL